MKMRNKGKVHPFTTASSSSTPDSFSALKLLPAAILTLLSFLSLEDREVLAYMITRSLKSTNPSFFPAANEDTKKSSNKQCGGGHNSQALFDCDCFHCYTGFWFRWDSSPNRELIHQAIEAFDDHLNTGDQFKSGRTKRKDKLGRRRTEKSGKHAFAAGELLDYPPENLQLSISAAETPQVLMTDALEEVDEAKPGVTGDESMAAAASVVRTHKGLARKVINYHWSTMYIMLPFYVYSWFSLVSNLAKNQKKLWVLVYVVACATSLIPDPLIEFRYYTIPFFFMVLHSNIIDYTSWLLLGLLYLSINCFTMYMFLYQPFLWVHEAGTQRFIW